MLEVLTKMLCRVDSLLLNIQDVAACSLEEVNLSVNFCVCWTKEQSQRCRMFPMDYFFLARPYPLFVIFNSLNQPMP